MPQPACESLEETIQQLTQDLIALDEQIHYLVEVVGMEQPHPWAYVVLQRRVDSLIKKKHALQDAYNRAVTGLAICRSKPPSPHQRSSARTPAQPHEKGKPPTPATTLVQATIHAWEEQDASVLASSLSDDVICKRIFPQPVGKAQLIAFAQAIARAFPDWSFNGEVLHEERLAEQSWHVLYVTAVTGIQTGDLILPPLPDIPATGKKIALPYRHLEFLIAGETIMEIDADFSPSGLEEVLAQLGLELP